MIYFVQQGVEGPIKIGHTKRRLNERINELQHASPYKLRVLGYIEGDVEQEKMLHNFFYADRMEGEWFKATPKIVTYILSLIFALNHDALFNKYSTLLNADSAFEKVLLSGISLDTFFSNDFEKKLLIHVFENTGKNQSECARVLNITRSEIRTKFQKYDILAR